MPSRSIRAAEVAVLRPAQPRTAHDTVGGAIERRLTGAMEVPIEQLVADPGQPRRDWDYDNGAQRLQELAASIAEFGVLQPLLVREDGTLPDGRQRYVIIAGARRRAAAELVGIGLLPVLVREESATRVRVLQLLENLQRQELSPLDEARAYQELLDLEGMTPQALAARLHLSGQQVRDRLRLLADQVLADAVERRQMSASAAREIMKLPDDEVLAFRRRVLAGERLQINDVFSARAYLAATGAINPRRKIARGTAPVDSIQLVPPIVTTRTPQAAAEARTDQTLFDPSPAIDTKISLLSIGVAAQPSRPSDRDVVEDIAEESAGGDQPAATGSSATCRASVERVVDILDSSLSGEERAIVAGVLRETGQQSDLIAWLMLFHRRLSERLSRQNASPCE
jgi:ParB/RepB/Spo0J family partition protein